MSPRTPTPLRVGVYQRLEQADRAVEALVASGFPTERISVICPACAPDAFPPGVERQQPAGERAPKAIATGGAIGALLGGFAAVVEIVATGGTGLLVAGPLLAAAGGVTGGFVGAMATRGLEPEIADYYDQALARGQILVAADVRAGEGVPSAKLAEHILAEWGAEPIRLRRG